MAMNLTKLSNAEYTLGDIREALDGDNALDPVDPTAYYTAEGNPPGYWIGSGAKLLGGTVGTTASSRTVRSLINERRDPSTGRYLGDVKLTAGDDGQAPVAGWDLTTRQPKSVSILWAFGDSETRRGIDECLQKATEMTIAYLEEEYATTRAGQGGVASVACDGLAGFVFDHYDTRNGDPQPHKHVVISNRVRRTSDGMWTALDGRKMYGSMVEISELHENLVQDLLTERFGWSWSAKPSVDGSRAMVNEVDGVPKELIDAFSSRDAEIEKLLEEKVRKYEESTGQQVGWKKRAELHKEAWQETRRAKPEIQPSLAKKRNSWYHKLGEVAPDVKLDQMWRDVNSHRQTTLHVDAASEKEVADLLLGQLADLTRMARNGNEYADRAADRAVKGTARAHTVWRKTNVRAEAERLLRDVRIDPGQRAIVADAIADRAIASCVKLTPTRYKLPPEALDDATIATRSGRSVFDDPDLDLYTTSDILDAERYMIGALDRYAGIGYEPGAGMEWLGRWNRRTEEAGGHPLAPDQWKAAAYALESPNLVSSIIGPAGTGKTTTMNAVAQAWQARYGAGSVIGLATSRRAVGELHRSIGCNSMTIAMLLTRHSPESIQEAIRREGDLQQKLAQAGTPLERIAVRAKIAAARIQDSSWTIRRNQLIIVDEAGMVDTRNLQWITRLAELRGAKVILTGDPKQLDSVSGAGGMLGYADRHGKCERLTSLWRFTSKAEKWAADKDGPASRRRWPGEAQATLRLREGGNRLDKASVDACEKLVGEYDAHDRIHWGEDADIEEDAYRMCIEWQDMGKTTLLIAGTNQQVRDINQRFILERRAKGLSDSAPSRLVRLRDGLTVGAGDQIVCRDNEKTIHAADGRQIENGMTFSITSTAGDLVRCVSTEDGSQWAIPRRFLSKSCEAGYAATIHRSQGMTVDRCAALFPANANVKCNLQYVAGTRGKEENHFLFGCKPEDERITDHLLSGAEEDPHKIALMRMKTALLTQPENLTATETAEREWKDRYDLKRLLREHDYAAGLIAGPHLLAMLGKSHDAKTVEKIRKSPSFEWLRGVWSRAYMTDPKRAVAIIGRPLDPKRRKLPEDKAMKLACHAARELKPGKDSSKTFAIDMEAPAETIGRFREMLGQAGIPFDEAGTLDGDRSRFVVSESRTPAVKAMIDAYSQAREDIDQSMFPGWGSLRLAAGRAISEDPDLEKKSKPVEPDWAATIAGRLNAGLLDRLNGSVHDEWVGGVVPPIRSSRNSGALDLVRQNERLIEGSIENLVREARAEAAPWTRAIADEERKDPNLFRDIVVYRAMWGVDDPDDPLGEHPDDGRREQHWANLNGRINHTSGVVAPPKPARKPKRQAEGKPAAATGTGTKTTQAAERNGNIHVVGTLSDAGIRTDTPPTAEGDRLLARCSNDVGFIRLMSGIADNAADAFAHGEYDPEKTFEEVRDAVDGIARACAAFGEEYDARTMDEAAGSALSALTDPINGRIAHLADTGKGDKAIADANRRDRMERLEDYYTERANLDPDERDRATYSLLPPTIRQSMDALTMTFGGADATDLMGMTAKTEAEADTDDTAMPSWDELRECSATAEDYFDTHAGEQRENPLPKGVERSLRVLGSVYGMGRRADMEEIESMASTLDRQPIRGEDVEQAIRLDQEGETTWKPSEYSSASPNGLSL